MKKIFTLLVTSLVAFFAFAQHSGSTVSINLKANKNIRVSIDAHSYSSNDRFDDSRREHDDKVIIIRNLQPGQHELKVLRSDTRRQDNRYNNNRSNDRNNRRSGNGNFENNTNFDLRQGYDLEITVNGNGSLELKETKIRNRRRERDNNDRAGYDHQYRYAMPDASFNELLTDLRRKWFNGSIMNAVNDVFSNRENYFNTYQVKQLIQLVTGEHERLNLAKASLRTLVDINNLSLLFDLFNSQSSRDELTASARDYRLKP